MVAWLIKIAVLALVLGAAVADWEIKFSEDLSGPSRDFADEDLVRSDYSPEAAVPYTPYGYLLFPAYSSFESLDAFLYDYEGNEETMVNVFDLNASPCTRLTAEFGEEGTIPIVVFASISSVEDESPYEGGTTYSPLLKIQWNIEDRSYYQYCRIDGLSIYPTSLSCSSFENDTILVAFHGEKSNDVFGYCGIDTGRDFQPLATYVTIGKFTEIDPSITVVNSRFKGINPSVNGEIQLVLTSDYLFTDKSGTKAFEQALIYNVSFDALVNQTSPAIEVGQVLLVPVVTTESPTVAPTIAPTSTPTSAPTKTTLAPSEAKVPTLAPSVLAPTAAPTATPTGVPTSAPTSAPTAAPTSSPTASPSASAPTVAPTNAPFVVPTAAPTLATSAPFIVPTAAPTFAPTNDNSTGGNSGAGVSSAKITIPGDVLPLTKSSFTGDVYPVSKDLCAKVPSLCGSVFAISGYEETDAIAIDVVQVQFESKELLLDTYQISKTDLLNGQFEVAIAVNSSGILVACLSYGQHSGSTTNLILNFATFDLIEGTQHLTWKETDGYINMTDLLKDSDNLEAIELQLAPIERNDYQGFQIIAAITTTSNGVEQNYLKVRNVEFAEVVITTEITQEETTLEVTEEDEQNYVGTEALAAAVSVIGALSGLIAAATSVIASLGSVIGTGVGSGANAIAGAASSFGSSANGLSSFLDLCQGAAFQGMLSVKHPAFLQQYWKGFGWMVGVIPLPALYGSVPSGMRKLLEATNLITSDDDGISKFSRLVGVPPENMFFTVLTVFCALEVIVFILFEFLFFVSRKLQNRSKSSMRNLLTQSQLHPRDLEIGLMLRVANFAFSSLILVAIYSVTQSLTNSRATASFALSVVTMIACIIYIVIGVLKIKKREAEDLENIKSKVKYGVFYTDFRYDWRLFFVSVLLYKLSCSLFISVLKDHPHAQLGALVGVHLLFLLSILIFRPFSDKFQMITAILTTSILLVQVILAFGLIQEGSQAVVIGGFTLALNLISVILFTAHFLRKAFLVITRRLANRRKTTAAAGPTEPAKGETAIPAGDTVKVYQAQIVEDSSQSHSQK